MQTIRTGLQSKIQNDIHHPNHAPDEGKTMGATEPRDDDLFDEDREIGWGDESLSEEEDPDIERLLADLPPHHVEH